MTREDIIRMAREAWKQAGENWVVPHWFDERAEAFVHFAALVAAAEREILADWMRQHGFSTGQAYTTEYLLDRLGTEMVENTDVAVLAERWECAKAVEVFDKTFQTGGGIAGAIRARSNP